MKTKKILSALTAAILALSLTPLAACKNSANTAPKEYTVTFDSQGGTPVESQKVKAGGKVTEPEEPTHAEGSFISWITDPNDPDSEYNFIGSTVNSNFTLYANWNITYKVYYWSTAEDNHKTDENGEWTYEASDTVKKGDTIKSFNRAITSGCRYQKWYTDRAMTNEYDFSTKVSGNVNLYGAPVFFDGWDFADGKEWWYTRVQTGYDDSSKIVEKDGYIELDLYSQNSVDVGVRTDGLMIPVKNYSTLKIEYKCLGDPYRVNIFYNTGRMTAFGDDTTWKNTCALKRNMKETDAWETLVIDLRKWTNNYSKYENAAASGNLPAGDYLRSLRLDFPLRAAGDRCVIQLKSMQFGSDTYPVYDATLVPDTETTASVTYDFTKGESLYGWQTTSTTASSYHRYNTMEIADGAAKLTMKKDAAAEELADGEKKSLPSIENTVTDYVVDVSVMTSITLRYKSSANVKKVMLSVMPAGSVAWYGNARFTLPAAESDYNEITIGIADYAYNYYEVSDDGSKTLIKDNTIAKLFGGEIKGIRFAFDVDVSETEEATMSIASVKLGNAAENAVMDADCSKVTTFEKRVKSNAVVDEDAGTLTWDFTKGAGRWYAHKDGAANSAYKTTETEEGLKVDYLANATVGIMIDGLSVDASEYDTVTFRFKTTAEHFNYRGFLKCNNGGWLTLGNTSANTAAATVTTVDDGTVTVTLSLKDIAGYTGTLNVIRFDCQIKPSAARTMTFYDVTLSKSAK